MRLLCQFFLLLWASQATAQATWLGSYDWQHDHPDFGGLSGIELSDDGDTLIAVGDRGTFVTATIVRHAGIVADIVLDAMAPIPQSAQNPIRHIDSEGLALTPDGTLFVSFESSAGLRRFDSVTATAGPLLALPAFAELQPNGSLEAVAIAADGTLYTIPERSGRAMRPFPVFRLKDDLWDQPFDIPRTGPYLVAGADIGPDGRLYILERDFIGIGFRSRVRRFTLDTLTEETLLETGVLMHDNLEGISVWHDGENLRMTLISDDNFRRFQRTEIVEYRLTD